MSIDRQAALTSIFRIAIPGGGTLGKADVIRAFSVDEGTVRFVLELPDADQARAFEPIEAEARRILMDLPGVAQVSIVRTAQTGAAPAPQMKLGRHPQAQSGPQAIPGVARILAVASGKGGVGKSTVTSNLAVALARAGRRVGLLDADIHGPSQPRMMGASGRPTSTESRIEPLTAHGVTLMSVGFMLKDGEAVVWRGPMLMGAMQQMLHQVNWGELDVLLIDLPPGTGDVQLTLCQKAAVTGALIVSTPQDVALLDARRAINMFDKLKTPVLGLIENMSAYICPNCGHEAHPFGHGGVASEARALDLPFLGEIPLQLEVRLAGDSGRPIALGDGDVAQAYGRLADRLIQGGMA